MIIDNVKFKNLSMPLKVQIVINWIIIGIFSLAFIVGLIKGLLGLE